MTRYEAFKEALSIGERKFGTRGSRRPKPANGVPENDRELSRRLNWLRERVAETEPPR